MKIKAAIIGAAIALFAFAGIASATTPKPYVVVAWDMPAPYTDAHQPTWPQTLAFHVESDTIDLNVLNGDFQCGHQYQIDVYNNSETTASLIAGGFLTGSNNPKEDLVSGGWGVAYRLQNEEACPSPTPPKTPAPTPPATSTYSAPSQPGNPDAGLIVLVTIAAFAFGASMAFMFRHGGRFNSRGQGLAEYALILALIAVIAIVALIVLGHDVSTLLSRVGKSV